jgi:hypothetical protein
MLCFGSILFFIIGALSLFAKDIMWEITQWGNSLKGIESEHTPNWDTMTTIGGAVAVILGLISLYAFFKGS